MSLLEKAMAMRPYIEKAATMLSDKDSLNAAQMFPEWDPSAGNYKKGDRVRYDGTLYKVLQDHEVKQSLTPDATPSLYATVIDAIAGTLAEWAKPEKNAGYAKGARVTYGGKTWVSGADENVSEPGAKGSSWTEEAQESSTGSGSSSEESAEESTGSTDGGEDEATGTHEAVS